MENVPLLQVTKMSKSFSDQLVLIEVNLQLEPLIFPYMTIEPKIRRRIPLQNLRFSGG
ncbi:hypothetical protein [Bacillus paramycoides]|uniref:hypothetical protein n=1 Tax=Bacillus paramycoides TaxID=2026194 RepID=UPI002E1A61B0|nr:hypothetical protein [Bacillus paramycoides]MED0982119.1 hypothetical protein [Bacillus paramycoides]MED1091304.1 hypothetical protein [Bacillus paramycoides]